MKTTKKLLTLVILSVIGTSSMAYCMPPIGGSSHAYLMCQQREAIEDQNALIQQSIQQQQQINHQLQMQEIDRYLDNRRSRCYKNHYGIIVCQ